MIYKTCYNPVILTVSFSTPVSSLPTSAFEVYMNGDLIANAVTQVGGAGKSWWGYAPIPEDITTRPVEVTYRVLPGIVRDIYGNTFAGGTPVTYFVYETQPTIDAIGVRSDITIPPSGFAPGQRIVFKVTMTPEDKNLVVKNKSSIFMFNIYGGGGRVESRVATYLSRQAPNILYYAYTVSPFDFSGTLGCSTGTPVILYGIQTEYGDTPNFELSSDLLTPVGLAIDSTATLPKGASLDDDVTVLGSTVENSSILPANFVPGVGDASDLTVRVKASGYGTWSPQIKPGWFYTGISEHYLFCKQKTVTGSVVTGVTEFSSVFNTETVYSETAAILSNSLVRLAMPGAASVDAVLINGKPFPSGSTTLNTANNTLTLTGANLSNYDTVTVTYKRCAPLEKGPIFVKTNDGKLAVQVESSMQCVVSVTGNTQVGSSELYCFATSLFPIAVYREDTKDPLRMVPSRASVLDRDEFCVEKVVSGATVSYNIYVFGSDPIYVTGVTRSTGSMLQQEECKVGDDLKILAMYRDVNTDILPIIRCVKNGVLIKKSLNTVTGNSITIPTTAGIEAGDIVGLSYYVNCSWELVGSKLYFHNRVGATGITITYETGKGDWDGSKLERTSPSYVQFNQIVDGVSSGFLYLTNNPVSAPKYVNAECAPKQIGYYAAKGQPAKVLVQVLDKELVPVPATAVTRTTESVHTATMTGSPTILPAYIPQKIDGKTLAVSAIYVGTSVTPVSTGSYTVSYSSGWRINWSSAPPSGSTLRIHYTPGLGRFSNTYPEYGKTDWNGVLSTYWNPLGPGKTIFTFTAGAVTGTTELLQVSKSAMPTGTSATKLFIYLSDQEVVSGTRRVYAYLTDVSASYPINANGKTITFYSLNGRFTSSQGVEVKDDSKDSTSKYGLFYTDYYTAEPDVIYAVYNNSITSNRITI